MSAWLPRRSGDRQARLRRRTQSARRHSVHREYGGAAGRWPSLCHQHESRSLAGTARRHGSDGQDHPRLPRRITPRARGTAGRAGCFRWKCGRDSPPDDYPTVNEENSHATGSISPGGVVKTLRYALIAEASEKSPVTTRVDIRFAGANGLGCRLIPPGNNTSGGTNLLAPDSAGMATFTEVTQGVPARSARASFPAALQALGESTSTSPRRQPRRINRATGRSSSRTPARRPSTTTPGSAAASSSDSRTTSRERTRSDRREAVRASSPSGTTRRRGRARVRSPAPPAEGRASTVCRSPTSARPASTSARRSGTFMLAAAAIAAAIPTSTRRTRHRRSHVTGAIALMLERNPALTHQQSRPS